MSNLDTFYEHYTAGYWSYDNPDDDYMLKRPINEGSSGYGDLLSLHNGIVLGRNSITHQTPIAEPSAPFSCDLGFHFVVDASYTLHASHLPSDTIINARQVWRRAGDFGDIHSTFNRLTTNHFAANNLTSQLSEQSQSSLITNQVVTIDFNHELLARWAEIFPLPSWLQHSRSSHPEMVRLDLPSQRRLLARAAYILALPSQTLCDRLNLESQALLLCQDLLSAASSDNGQLPVARLAKAIDKRSQIDQAVDIIRQEYHHKLTISSIAQRIGMNECYLKQYFKQHTGNTIAGYIRQLRMQEAMRLLLDEHKSVQEVAWYVGYRDPSNFSKAFTRFYGVTPTQLNVN